MIAPPPAGTDAITSSVITYVCSTNGATGCCDQSSGRWSLACVQRGAAFAKQNNLGGGDVCGRYAWSQGPIDNTQQYYPRDFNLFVTAGNATAFTDVQGPVEARDVNTTGFRLNWLNREPIALVGTNTISLSSGTVFGATRYTGFYNDVNVTYSNGARPTASSPAIDVAAARTKLQAMSAALAGYDATPAIKTFNTITFKGTDPELNVFSVASSLFAGTTAYSYDVPAASTVIVNVTGTAPVIQNAGFARVTGGPANNKTLWNFVDATSLRIQSTFFGGSILAPNADAQLTNGQMTGTIVVRSAVGITSELYTAPFEMPASGGCLGLDATWSCSAETTIDDTGRVGTLGYEAGFLEISGGPYVGEHKDRISPRHRIWYTFQPAATTPKSKPLVVFFNGGPGMPTMSALFAFNTATSTFDPDYAKSWPVVSNASSWTKFANLLYIDAPVTGFSYPVALADGTKPAVGLDIDRDAGVFLRVIARFLVRHPTIQKNHVVLAGESYGGTRATLMLNELYNYPTLTDGVSAYRDADLDADLRAYFQAAFGTGAPAPADLAGVFRHQVLIQPAVVGDLQLAKNGQKDLSVCRDGGFDGQNCDQPPSTYTQRLDTAATNLLKVDRLTQGLGVNVRGIEWLRPESRHQAYGRPDADSIPAPEMVGAWGGLDGGDNYFVKLSTGVRAGYQDADGSLSRTWGGAGVAIGMNFLDNVLSVNTFITNAKFDTNIWTPAIALALGGTAFASKVLATNIDTAPRQGIARPGWMKIFYQFGATKEIRLPPYDAGHLVPMRAPAELLADVMQWYASTP